VRVSSAWVVGEYAQALAALTDHPRTQRAASATQRRAAVFHRA